MKLKEMPPSLMNAWRLSRMPVQAFDRCSKTRLNNCLVSLTSIPSRLGILHLTIRSLLAQSYAPERILLWLHEELADRLPQKLTMLEGERFSIHYSTRRCAHRKLIETLRNYPDKIIVTCDDDMMYPQDWLERLWQEHLIHPQAIVAHECRQISVADDGSLLPYQQWRSERPGGGSRETLAIGYAGVLYPPGSVHPDVLNEDLFMALAPKADDLWFKAMALRQGTPTRRTQHSRPKPMPIFRSQATSLKRANVRQDLNRPQWQQLADFYNFQLGAE